MFAHFRLCTVGISEHIVYVATKPIELTIHNEQPEDAKIEFRNDNMV